MAKLFRIFALLLMCSLSFAQDKAPDSAAKSKEELEIMKGILKTTINFVENKSKSSTWHAGYSADINAVYLPNQGATFVIPASSLSVFSSASAYGITNLSNNLALLSNRTDDLSKIYTQEALRNMGVTVYASEQTPQSSATSDKKLEKTDSDREDLRKKIDNLQNKMKKHQEDEQESLRKYQQSIEEIKTYLIESLANYGDSLTVVKPEEYVNLVLLSNTPAMQAKKAEALCARKSWITDYKSGKLSLDAFKQKVLQYHQ
jgi:hypothetical protein